MAVGIAGAISGLASAGAGFLGSRKASKAAEGAAKAARQSAAALERTRDQLISGSLFGMDSRAFSGGIPDFAPFKKLDVGEALSETARANIGALPDLAAQTFGANDITNLSNAVRFERLFPGGLEALKGQGEAAAALSKGELPFEDALRVVRDRAGLANTLGLGGTQFASAVPRDLGLSRLQAIQQGGQMTAQGANIASAISPAAQQLTGREQMVLGPAGVDFALRQRLLQQASDQMGFNLAASPDPLAQSLLGLELQRLQLRSSGALGAAQIESSNALANAQAQQNAFQQINSLFQPTVRDGGLGSSIMGQAFSGLGWA